MGILFNIISYILGIFAILVGYIKDLILDGIDTIRFVRSYKWSESISIIASFLILMTGFGVGIYSMYRFVVSGGYTSQIAALKGGIFNGLDAAFSVGESVSFYSEPYYIIVLILIMIAALFLGICFFTSPHSTTRKIVGGLFFVVGLVAFILWIIPLLLDRYELLQNILNIHTYEDMRANHFFDYLYIFEYDSIYKVMGILGVVSLGFLGVFGLIAKTGDSIDAAKDLLVAGTSYFITLPLLIALLQRLIPFIVVIIFFVVMFIISKIMNFDSGGTSSSFGSDTPSKPKPVKEAKVEKPISTKQRNQNRKIVAGDRFVLARTYYEHGLSFGIPKGTRGVVVKVNESAFGFTYEVKFDGKSEIVTMNREGITDACEF